MPLNLTPKHYHPNNIPKEALDPTWNKQPGWMVIAAQLEGIDARPLSHALLRALWAEERNISDPAVRKAIGDELGLDGGRLVELETAPATQATYERFTAEAEAKGVFGAPTFVLDGERFWGQDRLSFVERKLERMAAS